MDDETILIKESGWANDGPLCLWCYTLFFTTSSLKSLLSAEGVDHNWPERCSAHWVGGYTGICGVCKLIYRNGSLLSISTKLKVVLNPATDTVENFRSLNKDIPLVLDPEYPVDALRIRDLEVVYRSDVERENYQPHLITISDQSRLPHIPPQQIEMRSCWILQEVMVRIKNCQEEHLGCPDSTTPLLPRRVIDVGCKEGKTLKLYEPKENERGRYTTLSYCWGPQPQFITTLDSKASLLQDMSKCNLSQTHLDAIRVTRGLGIRYLWIDALCIVQDSAADKMIDIPRMGIIYKNSTITIAASEAKSAHSGFLGTLIYPSTALVPFLLPDGSKETLRISYQEAKKAKGSHLDTRRWTLQESLLSPRQVTFGSDEVLWQCQTKYMEPICSGTQQYLQTFEIMFRLPSTMYGILTPVDKKDRPPREIWKAFVEDYSARKFTVVEDRWNGMAGIISELSKCWTKDECFAGFWKSSMLESLVWSCSDLDGYQESAWIPAYPELTGTPSWSWMSCLSKVYIRELIPEDIEIVDCDIKPLVEKMPHGALKEAILTLTGKAATSKEIKQLPNAALKRLNLLFDSQASRPEKWSLSQSNASRYEDLPDRIMFLKAGRGSVVEDTVGIMLEEIGDNTGSFRRIGCCKVNQKSPITISPWQNAISREWKII